MELFGHEEHEIWASWTRYQFGKCKLYGSTKALVIPESLVERWRRQSTTAYADLSEKEKQSDRDVVLEHHKTLVRLFEQLLDLLNQMERTGRRGVTRTLQGFANDLRAILENRPDEDSGTACPECGADMDFYPPHNRYYCPDCATALENFDTTESPCPSEK